ncbi:MAG TPA: PH domain-containing protein [Patescibacteria group bacterium]|nr:PH domain-containing protein [Patescibacteria group bacterium]
MPDLFVSQTAARDPRLLQDAGMNTVETSTLEGENIIDSSPPSVSTPGNPLHLLTSFREMPEKLSFETQEDDETILLFLRRHIITNIPWIAMIIFFSLLPVLFLFGVAMSVPPFSFFPQSFVLVLITFYYLIVISIGFVNFITWYYNIMLLTTKRVIDIEFTDLVYKNVAETKISLVQDVSITQIGVIPALFDYGNVLIQTAGSAENFDFISIPKPERVVAIVESLIGKRKENPL